METGIRRWKAVMVLDGPTGPIYEVFQDYTAI